MCFVWLTYAVYLYPPPSNVLSTHPETLDTSQITWATENERKQLESEYEYARQNAWISWGVTLTITLFGLYSGMLILKGARFWHIAAFISAIFYILAWIFRIDGGHSANIFKMYSLQWEIVRQLGQPIPMVTLIYFDTVAVLFQAVVAVFCLGKMLQHIGERRG